MAWEIGRLLTSPEGLRLVSTIKRLVSTQGIPAAAVIRQSVEHMERLLETVARQTGKSVKEVAEEGRRVPKNAVSRAGPDRSGGVPGSYGL